MLRVLFALLLFVHGLIHLLGFVSQWHLATVNQMTGKSLLSVSEGVSKGLGGLWLVVCLGFVWAAALYLLKRDGWLVMGFISVLISQALIIFYWPDAKAGTIANVLIAMVLGLVYANLRFDHKVDQEAQQLLDQQTANTGIVTSAMLTRLPAPVQQWLTASGVVGKERVHTVRLRQHGLMRTSPDGKWMPTEAEQYFGVDTPGFVWKADVQMMRFLPLAGKDKYADGKGSMLIKILSMVTVVDAADAKTDQGTLLRFLSEMCWFPSAALSPYLHWKAIDDTHASVRMTHKGVSDTATFAFDGQHRLVNISANRYMGGGSKGKLEKWYIPVRAWKTLHGVTIPVKGDVIWQLATGDFNYFQWEIDDIDYNKPVLY